MKMSRRNYLQLRFSESELASYQALADKANLPLAEWVRDRLNNIVRARVERCADCGQIEDEHDLGGSGHRFRLPSFRSRELSLSEISCPVRGCSLGSNHLGPCVPKYAESETQEIIEQNLLILSRDDPEGFRNRICELLKIMRKGNEDE